MRTLFLAPQPFFQERGTPIAVRLMLEVLCQRPGHSIDLLVYHEGDEIQIPNVRVSRIPFVPFLCGVGPGISIRKLLCDVLFFFCACLMILRARRSDSYDLIHCVEESVFCALLFKLIFGIPYIYDMDSSLSSQLTEKWWLLRPIKPMTTLLERLAITHSIAVVPMCDALAATAKESGAQDIQILRDISLLENQPQTVDIDLRERCNLKPDNQVVLYVGNLERYQGIDLLIESFALVVARNVSAHLIIVGGIPQHIAFYQEQVQRLDIDKRVHFIGPRPVSELRGLLLQADILCSPRISGENTSMKTYSYLHSGRAIVATDLPTNTQVLNALNARLTAATPQAYSEGILELLENQELRDRIAKTAFAEAEQKYTLSAFSTQINQLYQRVSTKISL